MRERTVGGALSHWDWPAIAAGVVVAVALQLLLSWAGSAFALSVGDEQPETGLALWLVIAQLLSLFLGAAFAAYLARAASTTSGAVIGAFTWALALVLGSALASRLFEGWRPADPGDAAWAMFLGALLSLATAMLGGAVGALRTRGGWLGDRRGVTGPTEPVLP